MQGVPVDCDVETLLANSMHEVSRDIIACCAHLLSEVCQLPQRILHLGILVVVVAVMVFLTTRHSNVDDMAPQHAAFG